MEETWEGRELCCKQLINKIQGIEEKTIRIITRTLNLFSSNQELASIALYLPRLYANNIWNLPRGDADWAEEVLHNSLANVHGCIPTAIRKLVGIKNLTVGYILDLPLAEEIAKKAPAEEIIIKAHPEVGFCWDYDGHEREFEEQGWIIGEDKLHMRLVAGIEPAKRFMDKSVDEAMKASRLASPVPNG